MAKVKIRVEQTETFEMEVEVDDPTDEDEVEAAFLEMGQEQLTAAYTGTPERSIEVVEVIDHRNVVLPKVQAPRHEMEW